MRYQNFKTLTSCQIDVTDTPTSLLAIIQAAGETIDFNIKKCNACELCPEGNIRYTLNSNPPSTTTGMRLAGGVTAAECQTRLVRFANINDVMLCSESGTVKCNIQIGYE